MTSEEVDKVIKDPFSMNVPKVLNTLVAAMKVVEAAWEIVEWLRKSDGSVEIEAWPMETRKAYSCSVRELGVERYVFCESATAPMAICEAFLKLS